MAAPFQEQVIENKSDKSPESTENQAEKEEVKTETELEKYWKAVHDNPTDFTGWTYLLQYVEQENNIDGAREAYDAFFKHYPYCYGYWKKYSNLEKQQHNIERAKDAEIGVSIKIIADED